MIINTVGKVSSEEQNAYISYLEKKHNRKLKSLNITVDGDYVDLDYEFDQVPFERIRRITGYLVGTMDNWNNAKSFEEKDRVKHGLSDCGCGSDIGRI